MSEFGDLSKLKVPELKAALKDRGLPVSGAKQILLARLASYLESNEADSKSFVSENNDSVDGDEDEEEEEDEETGSGEEPEVNGVAETDEDEDALLGHEDPLQVESSAESCDSLLNDTDVGISAPSEAATETETVDAIPDQNTSSEKDVEPMAEEAPAVQTISEEAPVAQPMAEEAPAVQPTPELEQIIEEAEPTASAADALGVPDSNQNDKTESTEETAEKMETSEKMETESNDLTTPEKSEEPGDGVSPEKRKRKRDSEEKDSETEAKKDKTEEKEKTEEGKESGPTIKRTKSPEMEKEEKDRTRRSSPDQRKKDRASESSERSDSRDKTDDEGRQRDRSRDKSREKDRSSSSYNRNPVPVLIPEEEPDEVDPSHVTLDKYLCDLNLMVNKDGLGAKPMHWDTFGYLYAGARSTWGVKSGKVCFEVKIVAKLDAKDSSSAGRMPEINHHDVRIGFSEGKSDLQLGEDQHSYAISMLGKKCTQKYFTECLEQPLKVDDVVTACIDLDSSPKTIFYLVNGENQTTAFEIPDVDPPEKEEKKVEEKKEEEKKEEEKEPEKKGEENKAGEEEEDDDKAGEEKKGEDDQAGEEKKGEEKEVGEEKEIGEEKNGEEKNGEEKEAEEAEEAEEKGEESKEKEDEEKKGNEEESEEMKGESADEPSADKNEETGESEKSEEQSEEKKESVEEPAKEGGEENGEQKMEEGEEGEKIVEEKMVEDKAGASKGEGEGEKKEGVNVEMQNGKEDSKEKSVEKPDAKKESVEEPKPITTLGAVTARPIIVQIPQIPPVRNERPLPEIVKPASPCALSADFVVFPHILLKNVEVAVNFGQSEAAFPAPEGFQFIHNLPEESRVRSPVGPTTRANCSVVYLIGLPFSGKTTWVKNHMANEGADKQYNVMSQASIHKKMTNEGKSRFLTDWTVLPENRTNHRGRWGSDRETFQEKAFRCLTLLFEKVPAKRRNFILDVKSCTLEITQRKRMTCFTGFKRKVVAILMKDDEYQERVKTVGLTGQRIPPHVMNDIKSQLFIPSPTDMDPFCDAIEYVGIEDEAERNALVAKYKEEGAKASRERGPREGYRDDRGYNNRNRYDNNRDNNRDNRDFRDRRDNNRDNSRDGGRDNRGDNRSDLRNNRDNNRDSNNRGDYNNRDRKDNFRGGNDRGNFNRDNDRYGSQNNRPGSAAGGGYNNRAQDNKFPRQNDRSSSSNNYNNSQYQQPQPQQPQQAYANNRGGYNQTPYSQAGQYQQQPPNPQYQGYQAPPQQQHAPPQAQFPSQYSQPQYPHQQQQAPMPQSAPQQQAPNYGYGGYNQTAPSYTPTSSQPGVQSGYGAVNPAASAPPASTGAPAPGQPNAAFPASWNPQQRLWAQQWQQYYAQQGGAAAKK